MSKQTVNIGTSPNDGNGDSLRVGGDKINDNFDEVYLHLNTSSTVSVSGGTITLDFNQSGVGDLFKRKFVGGANISADKTIAFSNDSNAMEFSFLFEITGGFYLQWPSAVIMNDMRWDTSTQRWTAVDSGKYRAKADFDGTNWYVEISQSVFI